MKDRGNIIIKDACIIIDLIELGLMKIFLELDYDFVTTENVVNEITDEAQLREVDQLISSNKIMVEDSFNLLRIYEIMSSNAGLSFCDATVLDLSNRLEGIMLTSDGALRKAAIKSNRKVHGILWAIEEMLENEFINTDKAINSIHRLIRINKRIPRKICEDILMKIGKRKHKYNIN